MAKQLTSEQLAGFKQFVISRYPDLDKSQLSQLDDLIQQQYARNIVGGGVPITDVQTDPLLRQVQAEQVATEGYKAPLTANEQKKADSQANSERIIRQLEDTYFGLDDGSKEMLASGRLEGMSKTARAKLLGINPKLKVYLDTLDSVRPTLARAAGDVGNLTETEQKAAIGAIPKATATAEEAFLGFEAMRKKFGLPERDIKSELSTPSAIQEQTQSTSLPEFNQASPEIMRLTEQQPNQPQESTFKQFMRGFTSAPYTPVVDPEGKAADIIRGASGAAETIPTAVLYAMGKKIGGSTGGIAGATIGKTVGNIIGESAQNATGLQDESPQQLLENTVKEPAKTAANTALFEAALKLLQPFKTVGQARQFFINKNPNITVGGENVAQKALEAYQKLPSGLRTPSAERAALQAVDDFSGKNLSANAATAARTAAGKVGYLMSGDPAKGPVQAVNRAIQNEISNQLKSQSPGLAVTDKLFQTLYGTKQALKFPAKIAGGIAISDLIRRLISR